MRVKRRISLKAAGLIICALLCALNYSAGMDAVRALPDIVFCTPELTQAINGISSPLFTVDRGEGTAAVTSDLNETLGTKAQSMSVELFGLIPLKKVSTFTPQAGLVMPGGCAVGITMHTDGLLVVGLGSFYSGGERVCPAEEAGLRAGDIITQICGDAARKTADLAKAASRGETMELIYTRDGEKRSSAVTPRKDDDTGGFLSGMWIRESTVGIGTLSYYDMSGGGFGALGHAVTDVDTGVTIEVAEGRVLPAQVIGINVGKQGDPGELRGTFNAGGARLGDIADNNELGIFGSIHTPWMNPIYPDGVELALPDEITMGSATILTTVDERGVREYSCEIIKLYEQSAPSQKGMVVRITDEELLSLTGGIVQGMSGSPVMQNGKLAGVITHVFLNDPTKGYGIYAMWMNRMG